MKSSVYDTWAGFQKAELRKLAANDVVVNGNIILDSVTDHGYGVMIGSWEHMGWLMETSSWSQLPIMAMVSWLVADYFVADVCVLQNITRQRIVFYW